VFVARAINHHLHIVSGSEKDVAARFAANAVATP
jgi:hypothetical protein